MNKALFLSILCATLGTISTLACAAEDESISHHVFYLREVASLQDALLAKMVEREPSPVSVEEAAKNGDLRAWHTREVRAAVKYLESKYGFVADGFSSWSTQTFSAKVTDLQLQKLAREPLVASIRDQSNDDVELSQWLDTAIYPTSEVVSWGKVAMQANDAVTTSNPVYVLDGWIEPTPELPNVRNLGSVNRDDLSGNTYEPSHARHVAGILAASKNALNTVGINPGAPVVNIQHNWGAF